ncbi:MAG: flippase-like domain-containing protein [Myxococcales bacterium]|nr:flippase-like domain-containing protein [Myxococcales bacterium]HRC54384.1 lysylphosphatidylglycerol synthase transmembrane domain-containing protein [Kofleriaceae bacterium]
MSEPQPSRARLDPSRRRLLAWGIGVAIVAAMASRVPFGQLRSAMAQGAYLRLAWATALIVAVTMLADSFSTQVGLRALRLRWPFMRVLAVRGATYLLVLLNYVAGQVGLGYYLHRAGVSVARAAGITLLFTGTTLATLLVVTTISWGAAGRGGPLWWTLLLGCAGLGLYLVLVAVRPRWLAQRELLAPLFEAGLRGNAIALLGRVPHVLCVVFGHWVAMRAWGLPVPLLAGAVAMPGVVLAAILPISPGGLGTAQAAMVLFFSSYAPGRTPQEQGAAILAFGVVYFVFGMVAQALAGLAAQALLRRQDRELARAAAKSVASAQRSPSPHPDST